MRIRTVKPEFWTNEALAGLSPFSRLLAIALLNYADDEGYFLAHPSLIRGSLFPFDEDSTSIRRGLDELSNVDYIRISKDKTGRLVGFVVKFLKHQRVDRARPSEIRAGASFDEDSTNLHRVFADASPLEGNGKGKGKGSGKEPTSRPRPTIDEVKAFCREVGLPASDGEAMFWKWESNGWMNGKHAVKDWKATIRQWKASGYMPSQKGGATANPARAITPRTMDAQQVVYTQHPEPAGDWRNEIARLEPEEWDPIPADVQWSGMTKESQESILAVLRKSDNNGKGGEA